MTTTFITLVNDTLRRLNEVELTATNFPNAQGFHAQVKDAVNSSIQEVSQREFEFPFNFSAGSLTLVVGTQEYSLASNFKIADWDSFRINYDASNNFSARHLKLIDYDTFIKKFFQSDSEAGTGDFDQPIYIYRTLDNKVGFTPRPDATYSVSYSYFAYAIDLNASTDTMSIPDAYKHVVIDGALYHTYMFRDNIQQAQLVKARFDEGIDRMRTLLINRFTDVRDTRVSRLINVPHGNA